jgi:hypothetical protein
MIGLLTNRLLSLLLLPVPAESEDEPDPVSGRSQSW